MSRGVRDRTRHGRRWWLGAAAIVLVLAAVASFYASSEPDGLERVAEDAGFGGSADDNDLADGPLADYGVEGVDDERVSVGLAGIAGVAVTLAVGAGLFRLVRRPDRGEADAAGEIHVPAATGDGRRSRDGRRAGDRTPERHASGDRGA